MAQSFNPARYAVLVVEDDALVRAEATDLCEDAGFTVYEARNAREAFRQLELHSEIRILFTDVEMPGPMDGLDLAHAVRERWPPVTIMVTSGLVKLGKDEMPDNGVFFAKPYSPSAIAKALDEIGAQLQN